MPMFNEKTVKITGCFVVWDAITRPDKGPDGQPKYSLKVVVNPNSPDIGLFHQLATTTLQQSKFQGVMPQGGRMPIGQAQADEFNGLYNGWAVLKGNSQRLPDVYDENGTLLDPMQYAPALYGGQQVDILVHCYEYDKAGNKGIATGLDAFSIIASANAQRQTFGRGGIDTSGAFGGAQQQQAYQPPAQQAQPMQQQQAPAYQQQQAPSNGQQQAPAYQQQQAPAYQQQQAPAYQQQQAPAYQQQQAPGNVPAGAATQHYPATQNSGPANVSPAAGTTSPSNGQQQPAQAHNFLPQQ